MTELMRKIINDGMDVLGGKGIQQGPRNFMATGYKAAPVAITVEGANILTRNLMIYGQGAIRCHKYVFTEMEAARENDLRKFDRLVLDRQSVVQGKSGSVRVELGGRRILKKK